MRMVQKLASALTLVLCLGITGSVAVSPEPAAAQAAERPRGSLTAFRSDAELRTFLRSLRQRQQRAEQEMASDAMPAPPAPPPPPAVVSPSAPVAVTAARSAAPSITNNQEAGVDEGGIVKVRGDHLVILRRGRLFTVSLAGGRLRPVDSINAFPPGVSGRGDWYDEMLVSGDRVIVVGYSYARGGTEINRFHLSADGRLRFEDAWHLRSNDYYSSRNYASRLIGDRLIFYTPLYLHWNRDPLEALPGLRRWRPGVTDRAFRRIAPASQIYIPPALRDAPGAQITTLHSVTSCDLAAAELDCTATGVLGPASRTFYVSPENVYLWISDAWGWNSRRRGAESWVYRLPLGRERPSAVGARGAPVDQFSFREDAAEGVLNILLRPESRGDWMFGPEASGGGVALLRLRFSDFDDGSREAPRARYRALPGAGVDSWSFHNRFVGDYILYGAGRFGEERSVARLVAAHLRSDRVAELPIPHSIDRIEALGRDAMVVGGSGRGLGFTTIELTGAPRVGDRYLHADSSEGETRSHAFFFSPDGGSPDGASGTLGLPVARRADPALRRFFGSSAAMVFLRRDERRLSPAGELEARGEGVADDACEASCVDWYGNARPIFLGGRTFALLGYELVEGELRRGRIREVGRVSFSPRLPERPRR